MSSVRFSIKVRALLVAGAATVSLVGGAFALADHADGAARGLNTSMARGL